jgi:hypothetical protein
MVGMGVRDEDGRQTTSRAVDRLGENSSVASQHGHIEQDETKAASTRRSLGSRRR